MRTLGDWVRLNASRHAGREAFVGIDGRITFGEVAPRAARLARGLRELGVEDGSTVGVLAGNTVFNAEVFLAVAVSGGIYAAMNWRWSAPELAAGLLESDCRILIVEERFRTLAEAAVAHLATHPDAGEPPRIIVEDAVESVRRGSAVIESTVSPTDGLCLIYTGGSTGTPKAVLLSHQAALANALNERIDCRLGDLPDERGLVSTPMFHSAGLLSWLVTHFVAGKTTVLLDRFDEASFVEWVGRERITNTFVIPNMLRRLLEAGALSDPGVRASFRAMHTGAGLLRMPDKERYFEALPDARLYFRYGLSEAGPQVTRLLHEDILDPSVDGSIGQEYTLAETQLRKVDDPGRLAEVGELGEIVVRGPSLMTEYFRRPEATADVILDGWLRTGDLATKDERGYYFFRDRLKEMIKSGGENVYCAEIEQVLYLHPAVLEAAVVGVPDSTWGEEVRAVVSFRNGATATEADLSNFLRGHIAGYKVPKRWAFLPAEEMPRSGAGKLVKSELRKKVGWD
ncbi:class I adenylate-forming enzyme family protein [Microbacterium sp. RD1]|uniref:class I adenylate-forming enzyme family protein n=1 Tax=Microbacterium sp. RD1 TaxID=3457313 RepID=UPI003FA5C93E